MKKLLNMKKKEKPIRTPKEKPKKEARMPKIKREKPKRQPKSKNQNPSVKKLPKPWLFYQAHRALCAFAPLPVLCAPQGAGAAFAVLARRLPEPFLEHTVERPQAVEAGFHAHLQHAQLRRSQQVAGAVQPQGVHIFPEAGVQPRGEHVRQVIFADAQLLCNVLQ